ncbi:hypothetical protein BBK36DRAFT_1130479 [Trichoderma citrinoviride]|uniref:ARID domain-containing protein n=1 Tax=Trichoderma citrinoviride TaxID=58853 RepID=A0A2T4AY69_9HYPO|nr:hypothetical protein BBK36DRAFT_1130479 [Trichoderma citrinoviride]PTB61928.1 hypothetical protein BBK36DRAFT_1130479 [Trichoderma citrinoviride]
MSTWMNDAVPNHNGNGFPHMTDPSSASAMMDPSVFMTNPGQFNPAAQFPNQQQMAMQNGPMRHASPSAYQATQVYQTNSVIPSKRPRPREDSISGSPRQNPGMLPTSRSETPQQQAFPGFQPGAMPQQNAGQFSHLQTNGSANASPSPIMGNQMRPGSVPQRVATASPHPFSPGAQQFTSQTSPITSEHGTPQPNPYMQNMPQGYNPAFAQSPSNPRPSPNPNAMPGNPMMAQQMGQMGQPMAQMPAAMYAQMQQQQQLQQQQQQQQQHQAHQAQTQQQQQQQQRPQQGMTEGQKMAAYQMRLQQQLQGTMQMQAQIQAQQNLGRGMMAKQQQMAGMPNGQMPPGPMRPQHRPTGSINGEQFMKNLTALMSKQGLPLDVNPMIGDRPVNLMILFQAVSSKGGSKSVTVANAWGHIAQALGLPAQIPNVPLALKQIYDRNLGKFEEVWIAQQKQRMMQQQQQQQQQQQATLANQGAPQKQVVPGQQMNQGQMQPGQQQQQPPPQQPPHPPHVQHHTPVKSGQPSINGFSAPQTPQLHQQPNAVPGHNRNSLSRSIDQAGPNDFSIPSPAHSRPGSMVLGPVDGRPMGVLNVEQQMPQLPPRSEEYSPCARELSTYGGVDLHAANLLGAELERWKPTVPPVNDLGNIDIAALTRSLQSGIHGEVRLALDTLATVSHSPNQAHFLQLRYCDDLVDALIDCAEEQLELLTEHTVEVSDDIQLTPYEEVVRACRIERWAIRDVPAFGTQEYELDRAVDRLVCISTILRNVSFPGENNDNHVILADESVIKFLCTAIRYLGTRTMLLRTHNNTLDFMKDVVILLSNIAGSVEIPGREQASCLLHFLLAFAPVPNPTLTNDTIFFTNYDPSVHTYLPHAVDALAKLLARDEPNRGHYKTLFAYDAANQPPYELLTRTFALAISPIPDKAKERDRPTNFPSLVEVRKPYLMQGLLAAEILAALAPGAESNLVRTWLSAANGLANNLFRLGQELSRMYEQPQAYGRGPGRAAPRKDPEHLYISVLAIALLRRLVEKSRDPNNPAVAAAGPFLPTTQALLEALSMHSPEWSKEGLLQHLSTIISLAG